MTTASDIIANIALHTGTCLRTIKAALEDGELLAILGYSDYDKLEIEIAHYAICCLLDNGFNNLEEVE